MDIPWVRGRVAQQAHVGLPEGTVEEEYGRGGFFGRYAHLYRSHAPVGWTRIEGPLKPRAYDPERGAATTQPGLVEGRVPLFYNADVTVSFGTYSEPALHFFRNADADEVVFVHRGAGRLETDFGPLAYEPGDYLVIPRGTVQRLCPTSPTRLLITESKGEVRFPEKGLLGQHALFDPAVLVVPSPEEGSNAKPSSDGEFELRILREGETTRVFYPFCPIDTVGWKGTTSALKLRVRDIRPVSSDRYHLPPSAHTTFVMQNAVICTFAPRPLENGDPTALKVPFYHSNIDFDEVLFYHSGDFFSREGIKPGMLTLHPQGIHHGPQAGAETRTSRATRTEEVAVMIDTRYPLKIHESAAGSEIPDYWQSWRKR
ncbi:MAG: homogentisate 1,2-dioxygenase [Polyangiaceae bacterium]